MSTGTIDSSGGLTTNSTLTNSGASGALQITGLASGINTNEIIQAELAEQEAPMNNMESEITGMQSLDGQLTSVQSSLQLVLVDVQILGDASTFFPTQAVTSTDSSLVDATSTGGVGAVIGSSTVEVTGLAAAAQRTFAFTSPTSPDTVTIDGKPLSLDAGATSSDLANAINSDDSLDVWASATNSGQIVMSNRTTGKETGSYIQVSDTAGSLVENTALQNAGQDAAYTINGVPGSSSTDTVTGAIPGVTLTLNGVTGAGDPVTVGVSPPAPDTSAIAQQVSQFVSDYNSALSGIESATSTMPSNSSTGGTYNPNGGSLYGDVELESVMSNMRDAMIQPGAGLPTGMASMSDIGITTGASTGGLSSSAINGMLTVNTATLDQALQTNPNGVQAVLQTWATNLGKILNNESGPGGAIQTRINGDQDEITNLQNQYSSLQTLFAQQEKSMEQQWATVEGTLSKLQSQSSSLTSFANSSSSSSSSSSS